IWMHTGMVHQNGEKMSKSLGNLTLVSDLLKDYSANAIRVTLLNHHYRYPWECFPADLQVATETVGLFEQVRTLAGNRVSGTDSLLHGCRRVCVPVQIIQLSLSLPVDLRG